MKNAPSWMQRNLTWVEYPSMVAFVEHLQKLPRRGNDSFNIGSFWSGQSFTVEETFRYATHGWPEATQRASELARRLTDRVVSLSSENEEPVIGFDVTGGAFDAGARIMGVPECWGTVAPVRARRGVRIVANIDASGGVSNDVLIERGAAVGALVMVLQARGHAVTVDVLCPDGSYSKRGCFVRVADGGSGSIVDIDKIVFALAHPGMLRVFFRGWTNGFIGGAHGRWDSTGPLTNEFPEGDIDLVLGGTHLYEFERYKGGAEQWILDEYVRQTTEQ